MTTQADYCRDEWDLILGAPGLLALILLQPEQGCEEVIHKKMASILKMVHDPDETDGSALVQAVKQAARAGQSPLWPTQCPRSLTDIRGWAFYSCRRLAALLAQKAPEAEAEAYMQWIMNIAQAVVSGSKDGIVLDAGQNGIAVLDDLAIALDTPYIWDTQSYMLSDR